MFKTLEETVFRVEDGIINRVGKLGFAILFLLFVLIPLVVVIIVVGMVAFMVIGAVYVKVWYEMGAVGPMLCELTVPQVFMFIGAYKFIVWLWQNAWD